MKKPVYRIIAEQLSRVGNLQGSDSERASRVHTALQSWIAEHGPSGSGIDRGTDLDYRSTTKRIVLNTAFHHMDDHGSYCGWTEHEVVITPCLIFGASVGVRGRNYRQIKDYLGEVFQRWLTSEIDDPGLIEGRS